MIADPTGILHDFLNILDVESQASISSHETDVSTFCIMRFSKSSLTLCACVATS